jgi:hypothetical protein
MPGTTSLQSSSSSDSSTTSSEFLSPPPVSHRCPSFHLSFLVNHSMAKIDLCATIFTVVGKLTTLHAITEGLDVIDTPLDPFLATGAAPSSNSYVPAARSQSVASRSELQQPFNIKVDP